MILPVGIQKLVQSDQYIECSEAAHIVDYLAKAEPQVCESLLTYLFSAIRRLPCDILSIIFLNVYFLQNDKRDVEILRGRQSYRCWTTRSLWILRGVCRKWRHVIQTGCAVLWSHICTQIVPLGRSAENPWLRIQSDPPSVLKQQILFAGHCLLDVTVQFPLQNERPDTFSELQRLSPKWRHATLVAGKDFDPLAAPNAGKDASIFPVSLDAVELLSLKISLCNATFDSQGRIAFPLDLVAPKLNHLELLLDSQDVSARQDIRFMQLPWNQLTHFSFAGRSIHTCIDILHLINHSIESLSILQFDILHLEPHVSSKGQYDRVLLPKLHTLELRVDAHRQEDEYQFLFQSVTTPALDSLTIHGFGRHWTDSLLQMLQGSRCSIKHLTVTHVLSSHYGIQLVSMLLPCMPQLRKLGLGGWDPLSREETECLCRDASGKDLCPLLADIYSVKDSWLF